MCAGAMWVAVLLSSGVAGAPGDVPVVSISVPEGRGPVGPTLVQQKVSERRRELVRCYRRGAFRRPTRREGQLRIDLGIGRNGQVRFARVSADTLHAPATRTCVVATLKRLGFPPAPKSSRARVQLGFQVKHPVRATLSMYGWEAGRGIDVHMVRRVLRSAHARYLYCFEVRAKRHRRPRIGTVRLRLQVTPRGRPQAVSTQGGSLRMPEVRRCVGRITRTLRFPKPPRRSVWVGAWLRFHSR